MAYQRCYFPMKYENLTQGYGILSSTHKHSYALDYCGKDAGKDDVYAPFDCEVAKVYAKAGHSYEVWLKSKGKVLCSNGYYGALTMSITHPTEIKNMKVGQMFKQGQKICTEGKEGGATGNHIHLELSKGNQSSSIGWDVVSGDYVNKNRIKPEEHMFLKEDSIRGQETYRLKKYHIPKESEMTKVVTASDGLNVHKTKDFNKSSIIGTLKKGDECIVFKTEGKYSYIYHYEMMGWVSKNYLK